MKKSVIVVLVVLAVLVFVSPGLIGKFAEESIDQSLEWVATETNEVAVSSQGFERGWFTSEGQHRVELQRGDLYESLLYMMNDLGYSELPALLIDTRIDHGLVPFSSLSRERGSLAPGLGSAVSTLQLEFSDGSVVDLPGTVYSEVGLSGELTSNLSLEPGSFEGGAETAHWGPVEAWITTSPSDNILEFKGGVEELLLVAPDNEIALEQVTFEGDRAPTRFGIPIGDAQVSIASVTMPSEWGTDTIGPINVRSTASADSERLSGRVAIELNDLPLDDLGRGNVHMDIALENAHGESFGNISRVMDNADAYPDNTALVLSMEPDLVRLLAEGLQFRIHQFDLMLQGGTVSAVLDVDIPPSDFEYFEPGALVAIADATFGLVIPAELYDYAVAVDPQVSAAAGLGFLSRNGDNYQMRATLKQGMLEVNGVPMPGLLPGTP